VDCHQSVAELSLRLVKSAQIVLSAFLAPRPRRFLFAPLQQVRGLPEDSASENWSTMKDLLATKFLGFESAMIPLRPILFAPVRISAAFQRSFSVIEL